MWNNWFNFHCSIIIIIIFNIQHILMSRTVCWANVCWTDNNTNNASTIHIHCLSIFFNKGSFWQNRKAKRGEEKEETDGIQEVYHFIDSIIFNMYICTKLCCSRFFWKNFTGEGYGSVFILNNSALTEWYPKCCIVIKWIYSLRKKICIHYPPCIANSCLMLLSSMLCELCFK